MGNRQKEKKKQTQVCDKGDEYTFRVAFTGDGCAGKVQVLMGLTGELDTEGWRLKPEYRDEVGYLSARLRSAQLFLGNLFIHLQFFPDRIEGNFGSRSPPPYDQYADAVIFVYSIRDKISFNNIKQWLSEFERYRPKFKQGYRSYPEPKPTPDNLLPEPVLLLLGTDCYPTSGPIEVPYATAVQFAFENGMHFYEFNPPSHERPIEPIRRYFWEFKDSLRIYERPFCEFKGSLRFAFENGIDFCTQFEGPPSEIAPQLTQQILKKRGISFFDVKSVTLFSLLLPLLQDQKGNFQVPSS